MKHLFAKYFNGQVEVLINNMRVDVVIGKIFLEIETGKNLSVYCQRNLKKEQLQIQDSKLN